MAAEHKPIEEFSVVSFGDRVKAVDAAKVIMDLVGARGMRHMSDPDHEVILMDQISGANLYLSDGALSASRDAGLALNPDRRIPARELPAERVLLLGDQRDLFVGPPLKAPF